MTTPYLPLDVAEHMVRERHTDPRVLAAHGSFIPVRVSARYRFGRMIVRLGRRIEGCKQEVIAEPTIAHT